MLYAASTEFKYGLQRKKKNKQKGQGCQTPGPGPLFLACKNLVRDYYYVNNNFALDLLFF